jgi:molybdopterin converting factor small subunit
MIEVHLYGKLRRFADNPQPSGDSTKYVPASKGDSIQDIIERMGIPLKEVGKNIFLNGEYSPLRREVSDGDRLGIFPDDMQMIIV